MSDPVTYSDIEDVLSSIRRLVSEDSRPKTTKPRQPEKLVLTPALRVSEGDVPPAEAEPVTPEPVLAEDTDEDRSVGDVPAFEPGADDFDFDVRDTTEGSALERKIAALERLVSDADEAGSWDQEPGTGPLVFQHRASAPAWRKADAQDDGDADRVEETPVSPSAAAPQEDPAPAAEEPAESAEETLRADGDAPQEEQVTPLHRPAPQEAPVARNDTEDDAIDLLAEDRPLAIDEDMLRDLVAEIVRQELQGALGERITRNVRKLVRREINRILVSKDFD